MFFRLHTPLNWLGWFLILLFLLQIISNWQLLPAYGTNPLTAFEHWQTALRQENFTWFWLAMQRLSAHLLMAFGFLYIARNLLRYEYQHHLVWLLSLCAFLIAGALALSAYVLTGSALSEYILQAVRLSHSEWIRWHTFFLPLTLLAITGSILCLKRKTNPPLSKTLLSRACFMGSLFLLVFFTLLFFLPELSQWLTPSAAFAPMHSDYAFNPSALPWFLAPFLGLKEALGEISLLLWIFLFILIPWLAPRSPSPKTTFPLQLAFALMFALLLLIGLLTQNTPALEFYLVKKLIALTLFGIYVWILWLKLI